MRMKLFRAASANKIARSSKEEISYRAVRRDDAIGAEILDTCRSVNELCISLLGISEANPASDETKGRSIYARAQIVVISTDFSPRKTENNIERTAKAGTDALLTLS